MNVSYNFGLPGAGKTYLGEILEEDYDFYFYDGDNDLPTEARNAIAKKKMITEKMRKKWMENLIKKIKQLTKNKKRIAVSQALVKEKYRKLISRTFPESKFILIKSYKKLRYERVLKREHIAGIEHVKNVDKIFELPKIKYLVLKNNNGKKEIINQINKIIKINK